MLHCNTMLHFKLKNILTNKAALQYALLSSLATHSPIPLAKYETNPWLFIKGENLSILPREDERETTHTK